MKKRYLLTFLFITLFIGQTWATRFQNGDLWYNTTSDSTVEVTYQYQGNNSNYSGLTTVVIPENVIYDGTTYKVTNIGYSAFENAGGLANITIPNTVTNIGSSAFLMCVGLKSIIIGNSVVSIERMAFHSCGLQTINIPNSVTSIGQGAFVSSGLTSITIPESVTSIGDYAFNSCNNLTTLTIRNGIKNIGRDAFVNCDNLATIIIESDENFINAALCFTKNNFRYQVLNKESVMVVSASYSGDITIPNSVTAGNSFAVTRIGNAFNNCNELTSVTIPNSVTYISSNSFSNCSNLASITIPKSVTFIDRGAFSGCNGLNSIITECDVDFSNANLNFIKDGFIFKVINKESVETLPNSYSGDVVIPEKVVAGNAFYVTNIAADAFKDCYLTSVSIPNSIKTISEGLFTNCDYLNYTEYENGYYIGNIKNPYVILIKIKDKNIASFTINNNCKVIYDEAFKDCVNLSEINLPKSLKSIGCYSFGGCTSLSKINIPDSVVSIGNYSFRGVNISSLDIPNSVISIGNYAFSYCKSLKTVSIPNSVTGIYSSAFENCDSIETLTYNTNAIGQAFQRKPSLKTINIGNSVTKIAAKAFAGCGITSLTIPNSVTSIGDDAFSACASLISVGIPNSVTTIGNGAFSSCTNLESVTLPKSVTNIGQKTFYKCQNLKSVILGDSVTLIGDYAFSCCKNLLSVTLPSTVNRIGEYAFSICDNLSTAISLNVNPPTLNIGTMPAATVYVPAESVNAYKTANHWKEKEILPLYTVIAKSANDTLGTVLGDSLLLGSNSLTFTALPKEGYHFVKWSDDNTDNPRNYSTASNASFQAIFEAHSQVLDSAVTATCYETGLTEGSHCSVCGEVIVAQNVTPKVKHTAVVDLTIAPTCTESGQTEGSHCSVCNEVLVAQTKIPALGHDFINYVYNNDATTTADGTETAVCERGCGATDTRVKEGTKLATTAITGNAVNTVNIHTHGNTIVVENATDEICVYDAMGRLVGRDVASNICAIKINNSGVYIVKTGGSVKRVMVK